MQSGITASNELQTTFTSFLSNPSLFALPITISHTSLTLIPEPGIPFHSSSFESSLPLLEKHLDPKTPCYIVIRRRTKTPDTETDADELVLITYIPSTAPVRLKTLYASTRGTVIKELGRERLQGRKGDVFATEAREVLDIREWEDREREGDSGSGPLTQGERELEGIKKAEEEVREEYSHQYGSGTRGRDLSGIGGGNGDGEEKTKGLRMKMDEAAREALRSLREGEDGRIVQLSIDLSTETLTLSHSSSNVSPSELSSKIPADKPSYTFYRHSSSASIIFIYCCPGSSKVKERMLYASSRRNVVFLAREEGVEEAKRIEIGAPDEIGEERLREELAPSAATASGGNGDGDEAGPGSGAGARPGFARPKRPGKR